MHINASHSHALISLQEINTFFKFIVIFSDLLHKCDIYRTSSIQTFFTVE